MTSNIEGMESLRRKLKTLENFQDKMIPPTNKALALMFADIGKTPRKSPGAFSRLASPAQKRAFWARVSSGEINFREGVGYVRSDALQQGWQQRVNRVSNGIRGILENLVPYARFVQGSKQQSFHRASGWRKKSDVIKDNKKEVVGFFQDVIRRELRK